MRVCVVILSRVVWWWMQTWFMPVDTTRDPVEVAPLTTTTPRPHEPTNKTNQPAGGRARGAPRVGEGQPPRAGRGRLRAQPAAARCVDVHACICMYALFTRPRGGLWGPRHTTQTPIPPRWTSPYTPINPQSLLPNPNPRTKHDGLTPQSQRPDQTGAAGQGPESDILTKAFLRKYIFYAKSRVQPKVRGEV